MKKLFLNNKFLFILIIISMVTTISYSQTAEINLQKSLSKIISPQNDKEQKEGIREFKMEMVNNGFRTFPYISKVINIENDTLNKENNRLLFSNYDFKLFKSNFKISGDYLKKGKIQKFIGLYFDTLMNVFANPVSSISFLKNFAKIIYISAFIILYILGIILLIKYVRSLKHDLNIKYKHKINKKHLLFLIYMVIVFAPMFLTISPLYLPLYWIILFTAYMSKKELIVYYVGSGMVVIGILIAMYSGMVISGMNTDEFRCYTALTTPFSNYTPEKEGDLQTFTLGTIELRNNNYRDAVSFYKQVDQNSPFFPMALNNLGVAYFKLQEMALARDFFNDALKKMNKEFIPHFNLSMTHLKNFNLAESSNELVTAFDFNSKETLQDMMVNIKQVNPIIATPEINELTKKLFSLSFNPNYKYSNLSGFKDLIFIFIYLILISVIALVSQTKNTSKACSKCGKPFVFFESQNVNLCKQCVTVFINKDDMDSVKRKDKISDIKKYNMIKQYVETFLSVTMPGFFNIILKGEVVTGIILSFMFFSSLVACILIFNLLNSIYIAIPFVLITITLFTVNLINVISWYKDETWH